MKKILVSIMALSAVFVAVEPAFARKARHFEGVATGSKGRERTIARDVSRGDGQRSAVTTVTGQNGKTATAERNAVIDRENGVATRSKTFTGPEGKTREVDVTATKTGDGQFDLNRSVTGVNGETRQQTGSGTIVRTDTGYSASGALTGDKGTTTFNRSASTENGVRTVSGLTTGPSGGTREVSRERDFKTGEYEGTRTITGPDGKSRSVETSTVREGGEVSGTRTVTKPSGEVRTTTIDGAVTPAAQ